LSVGFRIPVSHAILLPKLRGSDFCPGGTDSHWTRQPSLDAQSNRKLGVCYAASGCECLPPRPEYQRSKTP
jgi:hypothetical protein